MIKKFLRRFERLENANQDNLITEKPRASKRFECLEINEKKIEIAITDKIVEHETAPQKIIYYLFCPYCGKTNQSTEESCFNCKAQLHTTLARNYQSKAVLLKKCVCGAMNIKDRKNCWLCGKDFWVSGGKEVEINTENIITLNIDGKEYKSTDQELPLDIKILMERIRREGYKKEIIDDWVREKRVDSEFRMSNLQQRIVNLRSEYAFRMVYAAVAVAFLILIMIFRLSCH